MDWEGMAIAGESDFDMSEKSDQSESNFTSEDESAGMGRGRNLLRRRSRERQRKGKGRAAYPSDNELSEVSGNESEGFEGGSRPKRRKSHSPVNNGMPDLEEYQDLIPKIRDRENAHLPNTFSDSKTLYCVYGSNGKWIVLTSPIIFFNFCRIYAWSSESYKDLIVKVHLNEYVKNVDFNLRLESLNINFNHVIKKEFLEFCKHYDESLKKQQEEHAKYMASRNRHKKSNIDQNGDSNQTNNQAGTNRRSDIVDFPEVDGEVFFDQNLGMLIGAPNLSDDEDEDDDEDDKPLACVKKSKDKGKEKAKEEVKEATTEDMDNLMDADFGSDFEDVGLTDEISNPSGKSTVSIEEWPVAQFEGKPLILDMDELRKDNAKDTKRKCEICQKAVGTYKCTNCMLLRFCQACYSTTRKRDSCLCGSDLLMRNKVK